MTQRSSEVREEESGSVVVDAVLFARVDVAGAVRAVGYRGAAHHSPAGSPALSCPAGTENRNMQAVGGTCANAEASREDTDGAGVNDWG